MPCSRAGREVRPDRRASAGAGPFRRSGHSALTRGTEARTRPHSVTRPCRPARRGLRNLNRSFRRPHGGRMHSQFRIPRKQQRRVPAVRPVHSPLYRSLFLGIVLGAALPVAAQTVDAVRVEGRQHGRLARRCQPSRAGRADRFRQRDIARRRCGGGHRQHLPCPGKTRPSPEAAPPVRRAEHERGGFDGVVGRPGDRALRLPGLRGSRSGRGKGAGGATTARIGGSLAVGTDLVVRTALVSAFSFDGPYASARAGAASLEVGRNLSVGGDFVIDATPVGAMLVSSSSGAALRCARPSR